MHNPRSLFFRVFLLDCLGQLLILVFIVWLQSLYDSFIGLNSLESQWEWLLFSLTLYPLLGWLFGSYTVLLKRRPTPLLIVQRLSLTAFVTLVIIALTRWLFNPFDSVWLVSRYVQLPWMFLLAVWAFLVRLVLLRVLLSPDYPRLLLLAHPNELPTVISAWNRVSHPQSLLPVDINTLQWRLELPDQSLIVAVSPHLCRDSSHRQLLEGLEMRDPRLVRSVSVLSLFEKLQERLPPVLMDDCSFTFDDLPWAASFSVQAQLKRLADIVLASALLLLTAPFVAFAALLIWFEDRGPIFYSQKRSGWLGRPFTLFKLRTMTVQPHDAPPKWTQVGDHRITRVGSWLRRVRIDELPQLFNVLAGEMSLIGPRPERPELEEDLECRIPHYRKRHWMRPGLSGWAQVCAPYASSIDDSDLKLSYDLYYLRYFSTWLDFVILLRTVKTVLKAGGR